MQNIECFGKNKIDIDKRCRSMIKWTCWGFGELGSLKLFCQSREITIDKKHAGGYNMLALARVLEW